MRAMVLERIAPLSEGKPPLRLTDVPVPDPQAGEVRVKVSACGVCHTELDEIEGRAAPPRLPIILGHEVVGRIDKLGAGVNRPPVGERVGVGWIHASTGTGDENLQPEFTATGRDVDGGYAEFMTVPAAYAFAIPPLYTDAEAAPLLCAGSVGYRSLMLAGLTDGEPLGLTGFGGSAHLVLQMARYLYPHSQVFVFARDAAARTFAESLGAAWTGATTDLAPVPLRAIIDTTPAWLAVLAALRNLAPGGRLVINAIRKEDGDKDVLRDLRYQDHLWLEKEIKSVANVTGRDIAAFLPLAAKIPIRPEVEIYPLEAANRALLDLKRGPVRGAKVLSILGTDA